MKCSQCGTVEGVIRTKYLPSPDGSNGHITLTNRTNYCPKCLLEESKKFEQVITIAKKYAKESVMEKL